jgi:hypothetical protein
MMSVGLSSAICYLGSQLAALWGMPSQAMSIITGLTLALASAAPKALAPLAASAEGLALMLMQVRRCSTGSDSALKPTRVAAHASACLCVFRKTAVVAA